MTLAQAIIPFAFLFTLGCVCGLVLAALLMGKYQEAIYGHLHEMRGLLIKSLIEPAPPPLEKEKPPPPVRILHPPFPGSEN